MKSCWAKYLLWLSVCLVGIHALLSAGCGQKGDLYQPAEPETSEERD